MIDVKFNRNRRNALSEIKFENFQGMNCVDNNSVLPAHQVPFAYNTDFGRQVGAASKRFGEESIITDTVDLSPTYGTSTSVPLSPAQYVGQTYTTGAGVTNLSRLKFGFLGVGTLAMGGVTVSVYTDTTKAVLVGETSNLIAYPSSAYRIATFTPSLTVTQVTSYYVEIVSTINTYNIRLIATSVHGGQLYINDIAVPTKEMWLYTYRDLGATGVLSQHCFRSTAGDIPLIAHETDVYKLSGASTTRTTDTEVEFNAGTLTDVVVLADIDAPATAPTIAATAGGSLVGDYYTKVSFADVTGAESDLSVASNKLTFAGSTGGVSWSNIPTGGATIKQRKLYRTKANGSIYYLVATLDDNTTTTYSETVVDYSLTVQHPGSRRVVLARTGDTKNTTPIRSQTTNSYNYNYYAGSLVAQDYLVPVGVYKIYSVNPYISNMESVDSVTLTLYTDSTKATEVASATLTGAHTDGYQEFVLNALVTPGEMYYIEIKINVGTVRIRQGTGVSVNGELMYLNGTPYSNSVAMAFCVYQAQYELTGTYESEVIDLTTAPTQATLTFNQTLNSQTVAWYAKCSNDNVVYGDYQAVILSGDGMPLGRYIKIKAVLGSNGTVTPSITDYMISYNAGFGTATSIKGSLSGSRVRFTDWDDRVWFADGVKNYVYDGGFVIAPETAPTVATSGSGSLPAGTYKCKVAYVNSDSTEGLPCAEVTVAPSGTFLQFDWSAIPTTLGYTRKLYRTKKDGSIFYLVATLNDSDTTYADTTADASLTTAIESHTGHNVIEIGLSPAATCSKPPASTILHIHKNYAFYVEAAVPSRIYVSKVSDPHSIPSASYFQFPSAVLALKTYGDYLIASGKDFTWYSAGEIWDVDPAVGDWAWKVVSSTIGCISHEGMIECLDGEDNEIVIFPLATGIKYLNANLMGTDRHSVPLSRNVQPYFDQAISREKMSAIFWDQAYFIAINWSDPTTTEGNHNNAVFKLDLRNREWSGLWGMDISGFFIANGELYMTSSTCGRVYKYAGSDDDGEAIDMIVDSSYVGDAYNKRRFTKAVARIKKGCDTTSSTLLVRCDNTERTITLGANTAWAGAGGSSRTVQDETVSPPRTISGGRAHNVGWRFEDNTANDMVLYGVTIMAEPIRRGGR